MRRLVLPAALLAMALLIGAAMVWDCTRLAKDARERLESADAEMRTHEERLVRVVTGSAGVPPAVEAAVSAYREARETEDRHRAYAELVASCRGTWVPGLDPTHPLDRKLMDEIAGAVNRREISEATYAIEREEVRRFANGFCARVVSRFSSTCCGEDPP